MILLAYTIYDRKALQYHAPFFASADGAATRSLQDLANDPQTTIGRHPGDYVLYRVGGWDDYSGSLLPLSPAEHVCDALSLVRGQPSLPFDPAAESGRTSDAPGSPREAAAYDRFLTEQRNGKGSS